MGRALSLTALCQVLLALSPALAEDGWQAKQKEDGRVVQELKIEAPTMTEEDQYGHVMPERYRCDSCRAVMFHIMADLRKKQPKSRRLKQWEYTDAFDEICKQSFEGYGIKLVNGENKLSGPALRQDDALAPGSGAIQMGGESWTKRLGEVCRKTVYEKVGEEELYELLYKHMQDTDEAASANVVTQEICYSELKECGTGPKEPAKAKAKPKTDEVAKEKTKKEKAKAKAKSNSEAKATAARKAADGRAPASAAKAAGGSGEEKVDIQAYLRGLAVRHGLTSDEYLAARTPKEWEKLTVAIAGRIFNGKSDEL